MLLKSRFCQTELLLWLALSQHYPTMLALPLPCLPRVFFVAFVDHIFSCLADAHTWPKFLVPSIRPIISIFLSNVHFRTCSEDLWRLNKSGYSTVDRSKKSHRAIAPSKVSTYICIGICHCLVVYLFVCWLVSLLFAVVEYVWRGLHSRF